MSDGDMITFVNRFSLSGSPDEFERAFNETADFLRQQPGLLRYTLSRHVERPADYVNIAVWDSARSLRAAATHPEFAEHAKVLRSLATSESNLYSERLTFVAEAGA